MRDAEEAINAIHEKWLKERLTEAKKMRDELVARRILLPYGTEVIDWLISEVESLWEVLDLIGEMDTKEKEMKSVQIGEAQFVETEAWWYKCPECGVINILKGFKFCPMCGVRLVWEEEE